MAQRHEGGGGQLARCGGLGRAQGRKGQGPAEAFRRDAHDGAGSAHHHKDHGLGRRFRKSSHDAGSPGHILRGAGRDGYFDDVRLLFGHLRQFLTKVI